MGHVNIREDSTMRRFCGASRYRSGRAVVMLGARACVWQRGSTAGRIAALGSWSPALVAPGGEIEVHSSLKRTRGSISRSSNHGFRGRYIARGFGPVGAVRLGTVTGTGTAELHAPLGQEPRSASNRNRPASRWASVRRGRSGPSPGDIILLEVQTYLRYLRHVGHGTDLSP